MAGRIRMSGSDFLRISFGFLNSDFVISDRRSRTVGLELAAGAEELLAGAQLEQRGEGGFGDIGGVFGTEALGEHVFHTSSFHDSADGAAGDDAGPGAGGFEKHMTAAEFTRGLMG